VAHWAWSTFDRTNVLADGQDWKPYVRDPTSSADEHPGRFRKATADERDQTAIEHDATADERDVRSEQRDVRAAARESDAGEIDRAAASDRSGARRDRLAAKGDRVHARDDRFAASLDRAVAVADLAELLLDELTGLYRRGAGLLELEREVLVAERTEQPFVLAFVDVDDLKMINDQQGHAAGDAVLLEAARCMRGEFRGYDVLMRYGGDEFICGVAELPIATVAERFRAANFELMARKEASFSVGLAERAPGEGLASLIARADAAMYESRERRAAGGDGPTDKRHPE
jgi:diguanylate cyclase (GGDEF)-like protein